VTPAERFYREGLAHLGAGRFAQAAASLGEAARLEPGQPAAWLALGLARRDLGQPEEALAALERALALDPATPQANGQKGLILQSLGRLAEATECLAREARLFPQVARNQNNLGMAFAAAGREAEAQEAFLRAVKLDPAYLPAHANLAALFQRRGDLAAAETAWRQVIRLSPEDAAAHAHLGHILATTWRAAEAEPVLRRAVFLAPRDPAPARTLAWALRHLNRPEEARAVARDVLAYRPDDLQASVVDKLTLPAVYGSAGEMARARAAYSRGLDELLDGLARFAADPGQVLSLAWENFHLAYQGGDDRTLQEKYAKFVSTLGRLASPRHYEPRPARVLAPGERLRVGFLSSFFRDCTVGKYFRSWATDLDRGRFETFVYYTGHVADEFSAGLARRVEHHRRVLDTATRIADVVLADGLDVLVHPDVGMDTASYLLAGMRLAPVQCAAWGHPVTTGQPAIDHFLTCGAMEPEGAQAHYSERLVRLPGIGTRYARPGPAGTKSRGDLGLPESGTLYLCPQSLFKIHPDNDQLFARVLAREERAMLVFFRDHDEPLTAHYRERLFRALAQAGIAGPSRTVFLPRLDHADYLRVNELCDAMLDTLHWSGGNTTLDALASGLPVVTAAGHFMRGRQSLAMLRLAGVEELVARNEDEFVAIASRLAAERSWRAGVVERIREGSGRLFDDPAPIAALEAFFESQRVVSGN
jgi:predicted O-linked N-acetylglucosamine transferase (SPINDLY family)